MKENKKLEFKENISNTFLKTVSAFANYDGGTIIFGVDDNGKVIGFEHLDQHCLDIENRINDTIKPKPDYSISINNSEKTIKLDVESGIHQPYLYRAKAYKRNDTATVEVDEIELRRLILEGKHMSYEELPSEQQTLSFSVLEKELIEQRGITKCNKDILKTLSLYSDSSGYNNAAAILADVNSFPGIDLAKFGETISIIQKRVTIENQSILSAYNTALILYRDYYQQEEINGSKRRLVEMIPEAAFREAIANAIIHRVWDIHSHIRISMFDDRVEVVSPGGLPSGISKEEYIAGRISVLRNPILANVFNKLNMVEAFGTGIFRIKEAYKDSATQPIFDASDNTIVVILPVLKESLDLTDDERIVYNVLSKTMARPISDIMASSSIQFGKSKVSELLKSMEKKGVVSIEGNGRGTKYRVSVGPRIRVIPNETGGNTLVIE
ncbi:MAG: putative DNA binding domain-containing protein [Clostridia bacterium]|nr:putative DNA binding domain-containing protein [Clostridia bacterium]